ncbi:peroxidase family protein [Jannaschia sp. W003]|uniref:peroxidase family protein n=1 Tax=Jannaschia sp. W003 TaxID=2867012 RepID=UPI0021A4CAB1|nr:peroxidase family protein [Jannaschia sp. W003]UWQ20268.1 Hint domain-containing protein [Jannaschia sp. W003]
MSASDPPGAASRCPFLAKLSEMPRLTEARYEDGLGALYEGADPMEIAQKVFDQEVSTPEPGGANALFTTWGQFIDHDMTLVSDRGEEIMDSSAFPHGVHRSEYRHDSGADGPREYANIVTPEIDGSMIYGSTAGRAADLRAFEGGRLAMREGADGEYDLLPLAADDQVMAGNEDGEDDGIALAGDVRASENPNLLSLHTLWAREHNHWADRLAAENPDWTDQELYEAARSVVEYEIQKITYEEWLPRLLGEAAPADLDHDPDVDTSVSLEFSTAAFRFGHTLVASSLERRDDDGTMSEGGAVSLMDAFFDPSLVNGHGIDELLRGMGAQSAEALDAKVVDDLNFFLTTPEGVAGFSLPALNLMRSADHGMGSYVDVRAALLGDIDPAALDPTDFSVITPDAELQAQLASVYGTVHEVDLWVGGLAEAPAPGAMTGPLFTHIIAGQFSAAARGDETFGQLSDLLGPEIAAEVEAQTLADVIVRNTEIDHFSADPFQVAPPGLADACPKGTDGADLLELISARACADVHLGGGDDTVTAVGGTRFEGDLVLGRGDDVAQLSSGSVAGAIRGGGGNDAIKLSGTARAGEIRGGAGDDVVVVSGKAAVGWVDAGDGHDTVAVGEHAAVDAVDLGAGDDLALLDGPGVGTIRGGAGRDTLAVRGGTIRYDDGSATDGTVEWRGGGATRFESFEKATAVPCFTAGTLVVTALGKLPIETLRPGARVLTLDHGLQRVRWVGRTEVAAEGRFAPIRIDAGALGNTRSLAVSPQHRMLLASAHAALLFGAEDVLAPALALVGRAGIARAAGGIVTYVHVLFDRHEIVLAEGIPSESFHPGAAVLSGMNGAARDEVLALFPALRTRGYGAPARPALRAREARLLARLD